MNKENTLKQLVRILIKDYVGSMCFLHNQSYKYNEKDYTHFIKEFLSLKIDKLDKYFEELITLSEKKPDEFYEKMLNELIKRNG